MTDKQSAPYAHHLSGTRAFLDAVATDVGMGPMTDAYRNMILGLNHRGLGNPVPSNQDNGGLVFFTRPDLNLSYDNLAQDRSLMPLAIKDDVPPTLQRAIRCMLDPRGYKKYGIESALINHRSPFMHLFTNTCLSLSGWPDWTPETFTSKQGVMREQWSMMTGPAKHNGEFDLTASFKNTQGNPVQLATASWLLYVNGVRYENMNPHQENLVNLRKDYETRIYQFILDPSRKYIQMSAVAVAAFPTSLPIGNTFNFTGGETFMQANGQVPVNFKCQVAEYNDPIALHEFNRLVARFNPQLKIKSQSANGDLTVYGEDSGDWVKVPDHRIKAANYYGTPVINTDTNRIYWYVTASELELIGV